jgi:hypothetical protein
MWTIAAKKQFLATLTLACMATSLTGAQTTDSVVYQGTYQCGRATPSVEIEFFGGNRSNEGRFTFVYRNIKGSYLLNISESSGIINLEPTTWEVKPQGYSAVGARLERDGTTLFGKILSPNCGAISVRQRGGNGTLTVAAQDRSNSGPKPIEDIAYLLGNEAQVRRISRSTVERLRPISDDEARQVSKLIVLTRQSSGGLVQPDSFKFRRIISTISKNTIEVIYAYKYLPSGKEWERWDYIDRHPDGGACVWDRVAFEQDCEKLIASSSEAERLGALAIAKGIEEVKRRPERERLAEAARQAATAQAKLASLRRQPGYSLNAQDRACLVTEFEESSKVVDGACLETFGTPQNRSCSRYQPKTTYFDVPYTRNKCSYTIQFKDMCGSTIFRENTLLPGQRIEQKFQEPCDRVY